MHNQEQSSSGPGNEIFLALQGGGARGLAHVGGLLAIEQRNLKIKAVAGTSAGSMVAALVAAGYKGHHLVNLPANKHLFNLLPIFGKKKDGKLNYSKPTHLFTAYGWSMLWTGRLIGKIATKILSPDWVKKAGWLYKVLLLSLMVTACYFAWEPYGDILKLVGKCAIYAIPVLLVIALWGVTSVRKVRKLIDAALVDMLKIEGVTSGITFGHMKAAGCIPLKIVATNVTTQSLELFCYDRTPKVLVADAVAASICLPGIFKPWKIKFERTTPAGVKKISGRFLDGGIVSNLPAWTFDEDSLLSPGVPTVALSLSAPHVENTGHWLFSLVNTVVNGSSEVHTRASGPIVTIPLEPKFGMLDFDLSEKRVFEEVKAASYKVQQELAHALYVGPQVLKETVRELHEELNRLLLRYAGTFYTGSISDRLRVSIAVQRGNAMSCLSSVVDEGFMPYEPDRRQTTLIDSSHVGRAWVEKEPVFEEVTAAKMRYPAWNEVKWVLCFPLMHSIKHRRRSRPCVIKIDSNIALDDNLPDYMEHLSAFLADAEKLVYLYAKKQR